MKINRYFLYMALGVVAAGFTACSDSDDYEWAPLPDGQEVYFSKNLSSTITLSSLENSFSIPVTRVNGDEAASVAITATADDEKTVLEAFTIPSTISFAAGQTETAINIGYDFDMIDFDNTQSITIKITDENVDNTYGVASYSFKATVPAPWTAIGKATFIESWWLQTTSSVTFYQNDLDPTVFRVTNPWAKFNGLGTNDYFQFRILQPGETIYGVTVTESNLVYYNDFLVEHVDDYDDDLYVLFPSRFTSLASEEKWSGNYVESYQDNGLPAVIRLSPCYYMFNTGGWTNMLTAENITILFPGIQLLDNSVEVTYDGLFKSADDEQSVVATVKLGADVESAKIAIVQGGDPEAGARDIIAGTVESTEITASGEVKVPFALDNEEGRYSVVVVSYHDGEAQENDGTVFTYVPANAETWKLLNTGTYTYEVLWEGDDEGLELYQSESDPTRYKITHWGYDVDFKFTMNDDGNITVLDQETGYVHSSYGMVNIDELAEYTGDVADGQSYYEDGVFYFNVVYYVGAGEFGDGIETFTIDTTTNDSRAIKSVNRSLKKGLKVTHFGTMEKPSQLN